MESPPMPAVTIELYGVPRLKAGRARLELNAATLSDALTGLAEQCPALAGSVIEAGGTIRRSYRISLNGERFLTDPAAPLAPNDVLLLLAADVGG